MEGMVPYYRSKYAAFYALERLWKDCPQVPLPAHITAGLNQPDAESFDSRGAAAAGHG